jgi:hypothetical protein
LLLKGLDALGEKTGKVEGLTLLLGVCRTLVEEGVVEESGAGEGTVERSGRAQRQVSILGGFLLGRHLNGRGDKVRFGSNGFQKESTGLTT